ncbi:hypothetical protein SAMN05216285_2681 [Natrinema salifodinae]|uniref:Hsp20/alpha crystallin family protein n=2 Tax=Natrinema salifodinae TaxID=1202768 RepID=A0A1I0PKU5_9EURY|nr:hypothetical protein SAMN05216285_2681 [Natrinema salifodinae]
MHAGTFPALAETASMSATPPSETAPFPFPTQVVYDGPADRLRVAVDLAPAPLDDVTVEADSRRLRIAVERGGAVTERTLTPLPPGLAFGDERQAIYNNGVLSVSLGTRPRPRPRPRGR